jgi:hypothetical protein
VMLNGSWWLQSCTGNLIKSTFVIALAQGNSLKCLQRSSCPARLVMVCVDYWFGACLGPRAYFCCLPMLVVYPDAGVRLVIITVNLNAVSF